jgi:hypothetical protein
VAGLAAVLLFWLVSNTISKGRHFLALVANRAGGAPTASAAGAAPLSASKSQTLFWFLAALFSFAAVTVHDWFESAAVAAPQFAWPLNLLILMGFSATTAVGAKSIAVGYAAAGVIPSTPGGLLKGRDGQPDAVKSQMVAWSVLGSVLYLVGVLVRMWSASGRVGGLPDVDPAMLVLTGASQGFYLGDKMVSKEVAQRPHVESVAPATASLKGEIAVVGWNFGGSMGTSLLLLDGARVASVPAWTDSYIAFPLPAGVGAGRHEVRVGRDGEWSEAGVFTVA